MRLLVVAMANSIHTVRWLNQLTDQGWDIHLFPSLDVGLVHPGLRGVTVHHSDYAARPREKQTQLKLVGRNLRVGVLANVARSFRARRQPTYRTTQLIQLIQHLEPDIVHSMEIQAAGYLTLAAKQAIGKQFPPWIVTNWGSDIYYFGRFPDHAQKIREVLAACDYYACECRRDVTLAKDFGFKNETLPVMPNTGGFDLALLDRLQSGIPPSKRKIIMLKGYQGWAGRAFVALEAFRRVDRYLLRQYQLVIYSTSLPVLIAAKKLERSSGCRVRIIRAGAPHEELLRLHGQARISIGLSISDAISTSVLEAMAMGSFPIQSNTGCANEWFTDQQTGFLVPAEEVGLVAEAIERALTDDVLVDQAAPFNQRTIRERLDMIKVQHQVIETYQAIAQRHHSPS